MYMKDSVFTKIIKGDLPCHRVYEDDVCLAMMDIMPVQPGMVVLVSKQEIDDIEELPEHVFATMMQVVQRLMKALKKTFPDKVKVIVQMEGLEVPHAHVKLFPVANAAEIHAKKNMNPDHDELAKIAKKIRSNL